MIFEQTIKHVCSPDPLEEAKSKVQTRQIAKVIAERRVRVHSALGLKAARSIPTEGREGPVVA